MTGSKIARMPRDRRRELVRVAAEEFGNAGFANASLNKIIHKCRMSKSSFYYFVPSKIALFDLVVRDLVTAVAGSFTPPQAEDFAGEQFWPCAKTFLGDLMRLAAQDEAFMLLGRVFYKEAPADAKRGIASTLAAIREWIEDVLLAGRRSGAVRTDLPADLQNHLIFAVLRVFDEWTLDHFDDLTAKSLDALARQQFATLRRILDPAG